MSQEHPDILAFRAELLDAIRGRDGKLTWYQLRHVVARFPHLSLKLMPVLRDLVDQGQIVEVANPHDPGMPFYSREGAAARPAT